MATERRLKRPSICLSNVCGDGGGALAGMMVLSGEAPHD